MLGMALAGVASSLPQTLKAAANDRILVCVYLTGGNDGNSLIAPLESDKYQTYAQLRKGLALRSEDLLRVRGVNNPGEFGFHPALPELRDLYSRGVLGVVANVGAPRAGSAKPVHSYDHMAFLNGGFFTPDFAAARAGVKVTDTDRVLTTNHGVSMVPLDGSRSVQNGRQMTEAARSAKIRTQFPDTLLGHALRDVAGLIQSTSMQRAVFTVSTNGFDTHTDQPLRERPLLRELSGGLAAFYSALEETGASRKVVAYTDSEFGRSITPNDSNGTEDGWGNHHIVMGASMLGGDIHGVFPDMATAARDANGGWVPTTSRDQFIAML
jgi:uncharacterized protein (DUF1501 family)